MASPDGSTNGKGALDQGPAPTAAGSLPPLAAGRHRGFLSAPQLRRRGWSFTPPTRRPWYLRRTVWLLTAILVVGAAVFTDRSAAYTSGQRASQFRSFYAHVRSDLATCNEDLSYVLHTWHGAAGSPAPASPTIARRARQFEADCTPASNSGDIYDLESLQVPGALSQYHQLSVAVYDLGAWAYPHAARALLDISALAARPGDRAARSNLTTTARAMRSDAASAQRIFDSAYANVSPRSLPPLDLAQPNETR